MELFSEIYNCYYKAVNILIEKSQQNKINKKQAEKIINNYTFSESSIKIVEKLYSKEWNLFDIEEEMIKPKIINKPFKPFSDLQLSWLYNMVNDYRINLFLDENEILKLKNMFKERNINTLYDSNILHNFDINNDGDNYSDINYMKNFKIVLEAIKNKEIIEICFITGVNRKIKGYFLPFKMEYSQKDDKFRVNTMNFQNNNKKCSYKINISRIVSVNIIGEKDYRDINYENYVDSNKNTEPVVIEISKERNALERCMLQFARYEKRTEYDELEDKYTCFIYYNKDDESELLIQVLSFGPTVKVLGHKNFLKQIKERIYKQYNLFS